MQQPPAKCKMVFEKRITRNGQAGVVVGTDNLARVLAKDADTFTVSEHKLNHPKGIYFYAAVLAEGHSSGDTVRSEVPFQAFALGEHGAIFMSEGSDWTEVNRFIEREKSIEDATFRHDVFLAVGRDGASWMSSDIGRSWLAGASGQGNDLNSIALNDKGTVAVAVGADGTVLGLVAARLEEAVARRQMTTNTGDWTIPWKLHTVETASDLYGVTFVAGDTFVAIGENSVIMFIDIPESENRPIKYRTFVDEIGFPDVDQSDDGSPAESDNETSDKGRTKFWWADQTFLTLLQNNIIRIGAITLFMFIATHTFGLARYQFRLGAYYRARADALRQVDGQLFSGHLQDVGQLREFILALSPDHLETNFSSFELPVGSPMNRIIQIGGEYPKSQQPAHKNL